MSVSTFFCYAHEDEALLRKLKAHLLPLQRQGLIDVWHDRDISAGTEWQQEIIIHLNEANIILLLVSPDFMASDYCYGIEMKRALERHQRGEARVIPIILRSVYWQGILGNLQALPTDAKPVKSWSDIDEAFFDVTEGIRIVVEEVTPKSTPPSPTLPIKELREHSHPADDPERNGRFGTQQVGDKIIDGVRKELEQLPWTNQSRRLPTKTKRKLYFELRNLFLRKTFLQKVINCPDQNWGSRLRIACLTKEVLWDYQTSMKQFETVVYPHYEHLLAEVGEYCSSLMGLFSLSEPYHTLEDLEKSIHNTEEYNNHLPNRLLRPNIPLDNMARCDECIEKIQKLVEKLTAEYV